MESVRVVSQIASTLTVGAVGLWLLHKELQLEQVSSVQRRMHVLCNFWCCAFCSVHDAHCCHHRTVWSRRSKSLAHPAVVLGMNAVLARVGQMVTWGAAAAAEQDIPGAGAAGVEAQLCPSKSAFQSKSAVKF